MQEHDAARRVMARIGRVGVWARPDEMPATATRAFVERLESLGFGVLWIAEPPFGREIFSHSGILLAASQRITIATGIANIWARDAVAMANGARTLAEAYPERLLLGLGVSHAPSVARRGGHYERPLEHMRAYLDAMDAAPFVAAKPSEAVPRVLAALGPRMLALSAERTLGAHPYFVPVEHTRRAREILGQGPLLLVEQAAVLERDQRRAREIGRAYMERYLRLENYAGNLRRLGWAQEDLAGGGSDRLFDAIVAWGDVEAIRRRVQEHLDAGADHVCLQMLETRDSRPALDQLEEAAPALLR